MQRSLTDSYTWIDGYSGWPSLLGYLCKGAGLSKVQHRIGQYLHYSVVGSCVKETQQGCNPTVSFTSLGLRAKCIFYLGRRVLACVELIAKQGCWRISDIHLSKLVPHYWWWSLMGFASTVHQIPAKEKAMPQECKPWLHSWLYRLDTSELPGLGSARCPVSWEVMAFLPSPGKAGFSKG